MHDPNHEVAKALLAARVVFYETVKSAHDAGLPVGRIVGLVGFQNAQHCLGQEAVEPWRVDRGYVPRRSRDLRQHPTPASPAPKPARPSPAMFAKETR